RSRRSETRIISAAPFWSKSSCSSTGRKFAMELQYKVPMVRVSAELRRASIFPREHHPVRRARSEPAVRAERPFATVEIETRFAVGIMKSRVNGNRARRWVELQQIQPVRG